MAEIRFNKKIYRYRPKAIWVTPLKVYALLEHKEGNDMQRFKIGFMAGITVLFTTTLLQAATLEVQKVTDGIYALVGPLEQRSPENLGNNSTHGVIVTKAGCVLIDAGGSYKGAALIAEAIATFSDCKVTHVINAGGQDHRWFGNSYFRKKGAKIIASNDAVADQNDRKSMQITMMSTLIKDPGFEGTDPVTADITFDSEHDLTVGGLEIHIRHVSAAHTPGDSFIWVPAKSTVFTGDIVYVDRLLGVGDQSNSKEWLVSFAAIEALKPQHLVPGHGRATTLAKAQKETRDYLLNLRKRIGEHLENGGDMKGSVKVDQSSFSKLATFDQLAKRNAMAVFAEMEFD